MLERSPDAAHEVELPWKRRFALGVQREVGRWLGFVWIPLITVLLRYGARYRVDGLESVRREYRRLRTETSGPLLLCANHLTLIDSAIIAWALGSVGWYFRNYSSLPWNVPERKNFATTIPQRFGSYVMKCLPITRGGSRSDVARVLAEFSYVLSRGEAGLVFPEGGRSRSGRVDIDSAAPGVGRIVRALPGCRVLCVYLRGRRQTTFSDYPAHGEHFRVELRLIQPRSEQGGLRGSRNVARQILSELAAMEQTFFDAR